uniref:Lymphocyte antigen 6 family member G6E n=2 Tax=Sus scrofa TaxID=9823 RepID=A0A8D0XIZ7_PIG|nr:lymphocyte antigen 6 complex locus G6E [Sus scrofa]
MGTSSIFLCLLFLGGALGLTTSPAPRRLRCYTCSFAKPCYPVPTECQDDEVCGISVGTSGKTLV